MSDPRELKDTGLKVTVPRLKVLDLFEHSKERHLTAEDVYRKLLEEHSDIGLATVYRVLTQFEQAGLLVRHHFESGKAVFELNEGGHHDHLVCLQCGRVEEFYDSEIEKRQSEGRQGARLRRSTTTSSTSTPTASRRTARTVRRASAMKADRARSRSRSALAFAFAAAGGGAEGAVRRAVALGEVAACRPSAGSARRR